MFQLLKCCSQTYDIPVSLCEGQSATSTGLSWESSTKGPKKLHADVSGNKINITRNSNNNSENFYNAPGLKSTPKQNQEPYLKRWPGEECHNQKRGTAEDLLMYKQKTGIYICRKQHWKHHDCNGGIM